MDDHEREEWRSTGWKAGERYASEIAKALFQEDVGRVGEQRLIAMLSDSVREQCAGLRARGVAEPLIQEYGRALVESVTRHLRELTTSHGRPQS
ncbi:hypothetical protein [Methylobacterium nigriterrae]|uniref:hypothetical protein n=1 Tax=Methylobacterium nigriterrae TaxID=3127512 RepID=UPI003013814E